MNAWQFVAGGGEGCETPLEAARREACEEAGISPALDFRPLTASAHVPAFHFSAAARAAWGERTLVIPVHCFAVELPGPEITLSREHTQYRWADGDGAAALLRFDVDRTALWELRETLARGWYEKDGGGKISPAYVRIQGRELSYRTGWPGGIFSVFWRRERAGALSAQESALFHEIDGWFDEHLPEPPVYQSPPAPGGTPISWFKAAAAGEMLRRLEPLLAILERHGAPYDIVRTNRPGRIVYEDEFQVAAYLEEETEKKP
jgi:dATP pyrophosphohydrolase